jgi:hypothetical protein
MANLSLPSTPACLPGPCPQSIAAAFGGLGADVPPPMPVLPVVEGTQGQAWTLGQAADAGFTLGGISGGGGGAPEWASVWPDSGQYGGSLPPGELGQMLSSLGPLAVGRRVERFWPDEGRWRGPSPLAAWHATAGSEAPGLLLCCLARLAPWRLGSPPPPPGCASLLTSLLTSPFCLLLAPSAACSFCCLRLLLPARPLILLPAAGGWWGADIVGFNADSGEHQLVYNAGQEDESFEWADLADLSNEEIRQAAAAGSSSINSRRQTCLYIPYMAEPSLLLCLGPRRPQRGCHSAAAAGGWRLRIVQPRLQPAPLPAQLACTLIAGPGMTAPHRCLSLLCSAGMRLPVQRCPIQWSCPQRTSRRPQQQRRRLPRLQQASPLLWMATG